MLKKARAEAFQRISEDFRVASKALDESTALLAKIGATLGDGFAGNVGALSELTQRFKKAIAAGNLSHERSPRKKNRNRSNGLSE